MRKLWFFVFLHMLKIGSFLFCLFFGLLVQAQDLRAPVDFRQHNLSEYNASIFNPVRSYYGSKPQAVSLWTRWQWQEIDTDPTTLFLNYSRKLNKASAAGIGFFQHNTGVFLNTGALLNYAYSYTINDNLKIGLGLNLFGFKQELADTRFILDPDSPFPQLTITNDFIVQAAPGILIHWKDVKIGLSSENLFDYNFVSNERHTDPSERIYMISGGYEFRLFSGKSVLSPLLYYKSVPFQDNQVGLSTLFSADKYWAQAGYNSFYGASVGAGARFFKKVSIGALVEFATDASLDEKKTTFEIIAAYQFGKKELKKKSKPKKKEELIVQTKKGSKKEAKKKAEVVENDKKAVRQQQIDKRRQAKDAALEAEKARKLAEKTKEALARKEAMANKNRQEEQDALMKEQLAQKQALEQLKIDSLASLNAERIRLEEAAVLEQKRLDSISNLAVEKEAIETNPAKEEVVLEQNEKYEEVKKEGGVKAGFYLIANVFGTEKYHNAFVEKLNKRGLSPKSFLRSLNNYQYVYLERYDSMVEARNARNSKFFGKYLEKIWIFRVVGE